MTVNEFITWMPNTVFKTGDAYFNGSHRIKYACFKDKNNMWACYYLPFDVKTTTDDILRYGNKMISVNMILNVTKMYDIIRFYRRS